MSTFLRWMPLDVTDYLNDTGHLTTIQHGAYMLLLMHYWRHGPLPDDDEQLAAITKTDAKTWKSIKATIRRFFHPDDNGGLHQKRADKEREKAQEISAKRKAAGGIRHGPPPNGGANARANAPPNGQANAPPIAPTNAPANAEQMLQQLRPHNVPSTSTTSEQGKEEVSKNNNLLTFPNSARESAQDAAARIEAQNRQRKVASALNAEGGERLKRELFKDSKLDRWDQARLMAAKPGPKYLTPAQLAIARKRQA